jgi:hypothetical protein
VSDLEAQLDEIVAFARVRLEHIAALERRNAALRAIPLSPEKAAAAIRARLLKDGFTPSQIKQLGVGQWNIKALR